MGSRSWQRAPLLWTMDLWPIVIWQLNCLTIVVWYLLLDPPVRGSPQSGHSRRWY